MGHYMTVTDSWISTKYMRAICSTYLVKHYFRSNCIFERAEESALFYFG